ncbi:MAG: leucine-rich repeat domain-containing protein [Oscillibacter sp.]|nr:leucine-rich repeat domain-containing protein [Oscillibacter sp.]
MKRTFYFLLPLFLCALLTFPARADEAEPGTIPSYTTFPASDGEAELLAETVNRGSCGNGMTWRLDTDGVMTISGRGVMTDYPAASVVPWRRYRLDIWKVNIEYGVTRVGNYAFSDCVALTALTIPASVDAIGNSAFANCEQLSDIVMAEGVREIGNLAFTGCDAIESMTLPNSVSALGQAAFSYCTGLREFRAAGNLDETRPSLFAGCEALETVTLPDTLRTIGLRTFSGCESLTDFTIPARVSTIGSYAFERCASLQSIAVPERVSEIDNGTFSNCTSLRSVTIPDSVYNIKQLAFEQCNNLRDVYYTGTATQWDSISMEDFRDQIRRRMIDVHYGQAEPVSDVVIESIRISNGRVTVDVSGNPDEGSTLFIAAYDDEGRFLGMQSHPINDPSAYTVFATEAHTLTAFLLDSRRRPAAALSQEVT